MAGGSFRPGSHEFHWCVINADKTVEHCYRDLDKGTSSSENLGGIAGGPAGVTWSADAAVCVVDVIGSDGKGVVLNTWKAGKWGGWAGTGTTTLQLGVQGPPGPQGPPAVIGAFHATITPS